MNLKVETGTRKADTEDITPEQLEEQLRLFLRLGYGRWLVEKHKDAIYTESTLKKKYNLIA